MTIPPQIKIPLYRNAMELLAIEEIERQLQKYPSDIVESIKKEDAIAYALNRLPPLYATTFEGWYWQQQQARETLATLISKAVSWGIRAAKRTPNNFSTQLIIDEQN